MKYIILTKENKLKLERIFGVTGRAIYNALNYRSDSEQAKKIRYVAISQYGGRVIRELDITDGWQPNCQTEFVHDKEGVKAILSTFTNDVKVLLDCHSNTATITMKGEEVRRYWNVNGNGWGNILYAAEQMSIQ